MPRPPRIAAGDVVYHVLNRANARRTLFPRDADYEAFERILAEACGRTGMRLLAYAVMPNHWHLVSWPRADGDLSTFAGRLAQTHAQRWHGVHDTRGTGHCYQGRFKSFPVQADEHFLALCRYVEANPVRAGLVRRAQDWRWGSAARRVSTTPPGDGPPLSAWPVPEPPRWLEEVNRPPAPEALKRVRAAVVRGRPFGTDAWTERTAARLGLTSTLAPRGRPTRAPGSDLPR